MSIEGERVLSKMIPQLHAWNSGEGATTLGNDSSGWEVITPNVLYQWTDELDLSGISAEHLTTFFTGLSVQEPMPHAGFRMIGGENTCYYVVSDVISNVPFDGNIPTWGGHVEGQTPGFLGTTTNWDDVIMGSWREYVVLKEIAGNIGTMSLNQNGSFGSAEGSASRKLYFTRTVLVSNLSLLGDYVRIPPARFVAGIAIAEEKDHEYLMRLKRSSHNEQ
ncbi:MAG: hypothetical protein GY751_23810 [Bacteroidetes bacterium]|nr:hypothetical protein [Bacteroidota bacterium]